MSNDRIDLKKMRKTSDELFEEDNISDDLLDVANRFVDLLNELKRCYEMIDSLTSIECTTCNKSYNESDYGIKYHRITVPDDSLMYEYREDMQEHCIECIAPDEAIGKNCICDLCKQWHAEQNASE